MFFRRRSVLLVIITIVFVVLLNFRGDYTPSSHEPGILPVGLLERVYLPVHHLILGVTSRFSGIWNHYIDLVGKSRENEKLKEELDFKNLHILSLQERLREKSQGADFIKDMKSLGWEGVAANVIAYDPLSVSKTIWIDSGSNDGVAKDFPVMTQKGLVGRVVRVLPQTSQVLLLIDKRFTVDVLDEATRTRAMVVGLGDAPRLKRYPFMTQMEYLKLGDEINAGDLLMTSGLSDLYPRGIPVGYILEIAKDEENVFQSAAVIPSVDFAKIERVIVLTKHRRSTFQ